MAINLRWKNRIVPDAVRVYRSLSPFDANSLPAFLDSLAGTATNYVDETAAADTTYYYGVANVSTPALPAVALSAVRRFDPPADAPAPEPPPSIAAASYIGATVTITADDATEAASLPWDAVDETGATGFWSGANPTRLVVPTGASLVQITFGVTFDSTATWVGGVFSTLLKNGVQVEPQPAENHRRNSTNSYSAASALVVSPPYVVTPGDYFELFWNASSAVNGEVAFQGTWMEMEVLA